MPIYEYECKKCGVHEVMQKITAKPLKACEQCGGKDVRRLISGTSFTLKGGGWYAEGYGSSKKSGGEAKPDAKPEAKPAAKAESKTESSKPAAKPEKPSGGGKSAA